MELLGVLLGITMSAVAVAIWFGEREYAEARESVGALAERIALLEQRKAPLPVISSGATADELRPKLRYRTWNEDAVMPEVTK
jgi:hypothetical protein